MFLFHRIIVVLTTVSSLLCSICLNGAIPGCNTIDPQQGPFAFLRMQETIEMANPNQEKPFRRLDISLIN